VIARAVRAVGHPARPDRAPNDVVGTLLFLKEQQGAHHIIVSGPYEAVADSRTGNGPLVSAVG
jgi:hypothetical protein